MQISTYGNIENEKVLLIHPMFTNSNFFEGIVEKLKDRYFLIVPTLSGHDKKSTYISLSQEEKEIDDFLKNRNISKIKMIVGFSLGGNIAFDYFCKNSDRIDKVVVDSAPLFKFPKFIKNHFFKKYLKCLRKVRSNKENAVEELNKCFHGMGESQKDIASIVTDESLKNLMESCYNISLSNLNEDQQRKITFVYGTKDIARMCIPRIKKYTKSDFVILDGFNHCEYFMKQPEEYIKRFIGIPKKIRQTRTINDEQGEKSISNCRYKNISSKNDNAIEYEEESKSKVKKL